MCMFVTLNGSGVVAQEEEIAPGQLAVYAESTTSFADYTAAESGSNFDLLQRIAAIWKQEGIADQQLCYAKVEEFSFCWSIVPIEATSNIISRLWQQVWILIRITFGGVEPSAATAVQNKVVIGKVTEEIALREIDSIGGSDAFCQDEIIEKQKVLEGDRVNVLYNYAPLAIGSDQLHFLIVPKAHRSTFTELTKDEYIEAEQMVQTLVDVIGSKYDVEETHLLHKSGIDAGQTVPHWHMHVMMQQSQTDTFLSGRLAMLWRMVFGYAPLPDDELARRVAQFSEDLTAARASEAV